MLVAILGIRKSVIRLLRLRLKAVLNVISIYGRTAKYTTKITSAHISPTNVAPTKSSFNANHQNNTNKDNKCHHMIQNNINRLWYYRNPVNS